MDGILYGQEIENLHLIWINLIIVGMKGTDEMRFFILIIAVVCCLFYFTTAFAEKDPNSTIEIPANLGDFNKTKVIDNEPKYPGLGTTIYYDHPGIKATVYIYRMGIKIIPDGIESNVVQQAFDMAKADIREVARQGYFKLTSELTTSTTILDPETQLISALTASFSCKEKGEDLISMLYVFGRKNQIIKIRISSEIEYEDVLHTIREDFLKSVADWMK
jgi:hypothetical protein